MKAYFSTLCLFLLFSLAFLCCGQEKDNPFSQSEFTDALRLTVERVSQLTQKEGVFFC